MSAVLIEAAAVRELRPAVSAKGGTRLYISMDMTPDQAKSAVIELLGKHVGNEQETSEWLLSEFPDLFGVTA